MNLYIITDGKDHKIGVSNNVQARLSTLQVGNTTKLRLVYSLNCGSNEYAYRLESLLHKLYAKWQVKGEWFSVPLHIIKRDLDAMQTSAEIFFLGVGYEQAQENILAGMTKEQILEYVENRWPVQTHRSSSEDEKISKFLRYMQSSVSEALSSPFTSISTLESSFDFWAMHKWGDLNRHLSKNERSSIPEWKSVIVNSEGQTIEELLDLEYLKIVAGRK